ncbi:MAG: hypothetical protein ACRDHZ_08060 [Ktedonobacteraceae bacterium]
MADATTTSTTTAAAKATQVASTAAKNKHVLWGILSIAAGIVVGYVWIWGNIVQIQTSEAWIIGNIKGLSLAPNFQIYLQITQLGQASFQQSIAIVWGWVNQIILLAFSIGIEMHLGGKARQWVWNWGCVLFITLNSLADLSYGNYFGGTWQPWAFAGICFMASFFFGLAAMSLIIKGLKQIF